ncbi:MAG TPA: hypothetical protein PKZ76_12795 [Xanthomonadaceae bacterium]|nr:hypothetical protein [Xanthomonadaceae bacterium]
MPPSHLIAVAVRLFAVFIALYTLRYGIPALHMLISEHATLGAAVVVVLTVSVPLVIAVLLWTFPLTVAGHLLPRSHGDTAPSWHASDIQAAALAIIGVWLVASMLVQASYWIVFLLLRRGSGFADLPLSPEHIGGMVSTAVQLVLGHVLIFGARGLTRMLHFVRYGSAVNPK